jgi:hypothetical protein
MSSISKYHEKIRKKVRRGWWVNMQLLVAACFVQNKLILCRSDLLTPEKGTNIYAVLIFF